MPYGNQSPLLGSTIDPRLFIQDFSGYEKAASTRAMGVLSATNQVSAQVEDYTKQQKEAKDRLKAGATLIDAASKMFPSQAPMLEGVMQQLKDEDIPLSERSAIAAQIGDLINMGVGEGRYKQEYDLQLKEADLRQQDMTMRSNEYFRGAKVDDVRYDAAVTELDAMKRQEEEAKTLGPVKLSALEEAIDKIPESKRGIYTKEYFEEAKTLDPRSQNSIADKVASLLTPEDRKRVYQNIPVTMPDGTPGEFPALIDPVSGSVEPITLNGALPPMDGGVLPPKPGSQPDLPGEIATDSGEVLPANEAKLVESGKTVDVWEYQGRKYVQTKPPVPVQQESPPAPTITPGRSMVNPKETPEEALTKSRNTNMDSSLNTLRDAGTEQAMQLSALEETKKLLETVKTGWNAETQMKAKRILGVDVSNAEQFQTLAGKFVMDNIALTKGAISEKEMDYFKNVLSPGMGKSVEGNRKIVDFKIKYAQRAKRIAEFITEAQSQGMNPFEIQKAVQQHLQENSLDGQAAADATPQEKAGGANDFFKSYK